jgi:hypothetical protein
LSWERGFIFPEGGTFERGYIVLITPEEDIFNEGVEENLNKYHLSLGQNALIFYQTREQWEKYNPSKMGWQPAENRISPLNGNFVARVPATTSKGGRGPKINLGFATRKPKGAGIQVFEYAHKKTLDLCRLQLEALVWLCYDSSEIMERNGMPKDEIIIRRNQILTDCNDSGLLDYTHLIDSRVIDFDHHTICPLCLEKLSCQGFFNRLEQAEGREVPDLTVTELNLFHLKELKIGEYNHRQYNIGWGHHHCNVIARDIGIEKTLSWMTTVLEKNKEREKERERIKLKE